MVIPLRPEHSRFLDYSHAMAERADNLMVWDKPQTMPLGGQAVSLEFKPVIWMHTHETGLTWFAETNEPFRAAKPIRCGLGSHTVRIVLVDQPTAITDGVDYEFFLQPTPMKPQDPALRRIHKGIGGNYIVWYGQSTSQCSSYRSDNDPALRNFVGLTRRNGLLSSLYQAVNISGYHIPEVLRHHAEFAQGIYDKGRIRRGVARVLHNQNESLEGSRIRPESFLQQSVFYPICMRSRYRDMAVFSAKYVVQTYGADGIYMDNAGIRYCVNRRHDCGFVRNGTLHNTYTMDPHRDLYKRIQTVFHQMGRPQRPVLEGVGGQMLPFNVFADFVSAGEHFNLDLARQLKSGKPMDYYGFLDWETARREMTSATGNTMLFLPEFRTACVDIVGLPLPDDAEMIRMTEGLISFCIQHDCDIWNADCGAGKRSIIKLWKVKDGFGVDRAAFTPYWKNRAIRPKHPATKVGYYRRPGKLLVLVTNPQAQRVEEELVLDSTRLPARPLRAWARYHDQGVLPTEGPRLPLSVPARGFRIVEVTLDDADAP